MTPSPPPLLHPFPEWEGRVRAAFTTRAGGVSTGAHAGLNLGFRCGDDPARVAANWEHTLQALDLSGRTLALPRMVHGDQSADTEAYAQSPQAQRDMDGIPRLAPPDTDAVFTRSRAQVLAVTMADCLAILIFDPEGGNSKGTGVGRGAVAAVHAGWRGTRLRILEKTLRRLFDSGIMRAETACLAFSACLGPQSLAVGEEVAEQLDPVFLIRSGGRVFFDMPASNRAQALACGIAPQRLRDVGGDTFRDPERYFSYRRDGQVSGRMAGIIALV